MLFCFCFPDASIDGPNSILCSKKKEKRRKFPCTGDVIEGMARNPVKHARVRVFELLGGGAGCLAGMWFSWCTMLLPFPAFFDRHERKRNIKAPTMQSTNGKKGGWEDVPFRKLALSFCCLNKVLKSTQFIKPTYRCHTSRNLVPHTCGTSKYKKTASSNDTGYYLSIGAHSSTSRGWQRLPISLYFLFASVVGIQPYF